MQAITKYILRINNTQRTKNNLILNEIVSAHHSNVASRNIDPKSSRR